MRSYSILAAVILVLLLSVASAGKYSGGSSEPNDPYLISTAEDMNAIGANPDDWDAHFLLVADINLADYTGVQFNIIGYYESDGSPNNLPFTGVFDGNGHTISNFNYGCAGTCGIGIFGYINDIKAEVKDLTLIDPSVNAAGNSDGIGSLVGVLESGSISGCGAKGGSVSGDDGIGGLVGGNSGLIFNCYAGGSISGDDSVGGLAGGVGMGLVSNCYATGMVSGNFHVGGLAGMSMWSTISNCYATGSVSGLSDTGGLVGYGYADEVTSSFWDIETSRQSTSDGGTPKTTAEMKRQSTFTDAGWDFIEIWNIGENQTYPFLRVYPAGDINHDDIVNFYDFAILASHWLEGI